MVRKRIYSVILVLLLMIALIGCADSEDSEYGTVLHEESPHGRYWVSAYCPEGYGNLGGDAEIEFTVYDDENKSTETRFSFDVYTGCKKPDENNYSIEWKEDYVIITVSDDPGGPNVYEEKVVRVYWEDLSEE